MYTIVNRVPMTLNNEHRLIEFYSRKVTKIIKLWFGCSNMLNFFQRWIPFFTHISYFNHNKAKYFWSLYHGRLWSKSNAFEFFHFLCMVWSCECNLRHVRTANVTTDFDWFSGMPWHDWIVTIVLVCKFGFSMPFNKFIH